MIVIEEKKSNKVPSITSLYLSLPSYSMTMFDVLSRLDVSVYDKKTREFEISINNLFFVINMLTQYDDVKYIPYKETERRREEKIEDYHFKKEPFGHQIDAIDYGLNHDGWLLLDEPGLGKTGSMIWLAEVLKHRHEIEHCLIICGVNSLKFNWLNEITEFSNLSAKVLGDRITRRGTHKIGSIAERIDELKKPIEEFFVITNIETLQDKKFVEAYRKSVNKFDMIVLDEAHRVKEPNNMSSRTFVKLDAKYKIALTGTLIVNAPENAYLALKWTGNTNSNYTNFKRLYNEFGGFGGHQCVGTKNLDLLRELIQSCSLRRRKEDVLDLPEIIYSIEYVELLPKQRKLYDDVQKLVLDDLDKLDHKPTIDEEITINLRLRQITASPSILSTDVSESAKIERAKELSEEIISQGDKIVLFCNFKETAHELALALKEYNPLVCTGDVPDTKIESYKKEFNENPEVKMLICTWQKMGTGHTLTSANYAIFIDTPYTHSSFKQAAERVYRIGQNKTTFIITLISKDTYDERVQEIIDRKLELSEYLEDGKEIL